MPKTPSSNPTGLKCDPRLTLEALQYRKTANPPLVSVEALGRINVTVWLYVNEAGVKRTQANPNVPLALIKKQFGPAPTPDAETGLHSEVFAAEFFRVNPRLRVLEIFSERTPCRKMCAPLLRHYFPGVPWFYYYDRESWRGPDGELIKRAGEILQVAYGL